MHTTTVDHNPAAPWWRCTCGARGWARVGNGWRCGSCGCEAARARAGRRQFSEPGTSGHPRATGAAPAGERAAHAQEPSRAWLGARPVEHRPRISHHAHLAGQQGVTDPAVVLEKIYDALHRRLRHALADDIAGLTDDLTALSDDRPGALAYARWVIQYWKLSPVERQQVKAARGSDYQASAMATKPASDRQVSYLRSLGYTGSTPDNMAAASALIDSLKRCRL